MTDKVPHTFPISWDEFHRHCKALAWRLLDRGPWQGIIAISRGGFVPAAIVARELDVRLIESVCIASYDHMSQRAIQMLKPAVAVQGKGKGWLVVDDLVDTGKTFELLRAQFPEAHYAAVYAKPQGRPLVETFITEVSQDTWIHFPWDLDPQFSKPIVEARRNAG